MFFNPAVMRGTGTNHTTDRFRRVNLLQVPSAFGPAMETLNRTRMRHAPCPVLAAVPGLNIAHVIAASAEGCPFPTNPDSNPPIGGMAPKTRVDFLREAFATGQSADDFFATLAVLDAKNLSRGGPHDAD